MKLFDVSNHGLAIIGVLVAVLWGVIFMERSLNAHTQQVYEELQRSLPATPAVNQPSPEDPKPILPGPSDWTVS